MDIHYDEAWCPVCDRQIMPKRYTVAVPLQQQQPPARSPPSTGESLSSVPTPCASQPQHTASKDPSNDKTRTKSGAGRVRGGGLLHGTGRVRPNPALKHTEPKTRTSPPQQQPRQPVPTKLRTVIDQGPIPLYCSDECRLSDLNKRDGAYSIDFNPNRASPPLPPVPHNSFDGQVFFESEDESGCGSGSSLESRSSSSDSGPVSPSMATLAAIYDFPPLPPPGPILPIDGNAKALEPDHRFNEYQGGIMMVSKKIEAALCNETSNKQRSSFNTEAHQPIPGWTDGSHAWRESVYNFSPRPSSITTVGTEQKPSFAASSHRGVQWTLTHGTPGSPSSLPATQCSNPPIPRSSQSYQDELYAKYYSNLTRRSESRTTLFPPSTSHSSSSLAPLAPSTTSTTRRRRENPVIKAKAEGRLLMPNVTSRTHSSSSQSVSSASLCSPLSRDTSELSEDSMSSDQRSSSDSAPHHSRAPVSGMFCTAPCTPSHSCPDSVF